MPTAGTGTAERRGVASPLGHSGPFGTVAYFGLRSWSRTAVSEGWRGHGCFLSRVAEGGGSGGGGRVASTCAAGPPEKVEQENRRPQESPRGWAWDRDILARRPCSAIACPPLSCSVRLRRTARTFSAAACRLRGCRCPFPLAGVVPFQGCAAGLTNRPAGGLRDPGVTPFCCARAMPPMCGTALKTEGVSHAA